MEIDKSVVQRRSETPFRVAFLGLLSVLLTILFALLRVGGYIDWSWWWVLAPLLAFWAVSIAGLLLAALFIFILDRRARPARDDPRAEQPTRSKWPGSR
ncbi:MAG: hypothetical protein DI556_19700 [Rhodovulum sulfidophilum]|uniref:Uncharacterized protein n=1 Tax=Rhodovulum sulfidophilum TaxID=35806 RepID=A0A2W5MZ71_RHOSU|nr:MAG: hypothetical protein DI556_19700 [Rhodovulum sulfidophilum]